MCTTMVLVGCGKAKAENAREAQSLYTSSYFHKKKKYAQSVGDEWRILSAKHGILHPERVIDPYETRIDDVNQSQWAEQVKASLDELEFGTLIILAGSDYTTPVDDALKSYKAKRPFDETEGIGEQESWLTEQLHTIRLQQHNNATDW